MKKRVISLVLSVVLVMACFIVPANAEDGVTATTTASAVTLSRGDTVTVSVALSAAVSAQSGSVELAYDTDVLQLVSGSWGIPAGALMSAFFVSNGKGAYAFAADTQVSGTIFTATFNVLDAAGFGESSVTAAIQLKTINGNAITVNNVAATISVVCKAHTFTAQNTDAKYLADAATCQAPAKYYYSCVDCGEKGTETFESGAKLDHTYDQKVEKDEYLASAASCTSSATYYYACKCGAKGTTTYESGSKLPHTFDQKKVDAAYLKSAADCENAAVYYYSCACGEKGTTTFTNGDKLGHTGGTATCTALAVCTRCGKGYGELKAHVYDKQVVNEKYLNAEADCTHKATYFYSCVCGAKGDKTFEYGNTASHNYTKKIVTKNYLKSEATCTSPAIYYYACSGCDAKATVETYTDGDPIAHTYKQIVDAKYLKSAADCENAAVYYESCEVCGKQGDKTFTNGDKLGHTGGTATCTALAVCTRCGKGYGELKAHVYDKQVVNEKYLNAEADCTHKATYFYSCVCGAKGDKTFEYGNTASHNYTKKIVTKNYLKSEATCTSPAIYYYACSGCDAKATVETYTDGDPIAHAYKQIVDAKYLKSAADCENAAVYYESCEVCGKQGDKTFTNGDKLGHTGGTATCTALAVCTRCGKGYGELKAHVYDKQVTTDAYLNKGADCKNSATYFYSCYCGAKGDKTFEYGTPASHNFVDKITTKDYLKSEATCTSPAIYYFACSGCGEKGTTTYESGSKLSHTFDQKKVDAKYLKSAADCENAAVYYYSCACGEKGTTTFTNGDKLGHTGGTATCTALAVCTRCGKGYGELKAHTFDQKKETEDYLKAAASCTNKATYYYSCACGAKGEATFEVGEKLAHTFDQQKAEAEYLKFAGSCTEKAVYYYSCACGEKGTETFEYGEAVHAWATEWSSNETEHWHVCTKCGEKKDTDAHVPGAEVSIYVDQTCDVCGYVIKKASAHAHLYNEWLTDDTHHQGVCTSCGLKGVRVEHVYTNECDDTCDVCGYVRKNTHTNLEWKTDANKHWHECADCGLKVDEADHTWDNGVITKPATEQAEGEKTFTCTVCKATKTEAIAKLPATTTQAPVTTEPTVTTQAPVTTEPPVTETPVETTTAAPDTTEAPVTTVPADTTTAAPSTEAPVTEAPKTEDGCGGFVALGIVACMIPAAVIICRKKED